MLTRAEAEIRDRIKSSHDLENLCRQFGAVPEIDYCCLSPGEVRSFMADLIALRQRTQAIKYKSCPLPAGLFRPRAGERIQEHHRHEWR